MEELIGLIKARPFLYNCKNPHFNCREKKMGGWNEIAKIMGSESGNYWRLKWNTLKVNYSKYKAIHEDPSKELYRKYKKWPWAEHMKFTDDFPNKRIFKKKLKVENIKDSSEVIEEEFLIYDDFNEPDNLSHNENIKGRVEPKFSEELSEFINVTESEGNLRRNQVYVVEKDSSEENVDVPVEDIKVIIQANNDVCSKQRKLKSDSQEKFSDYLIRKRNNNKNKQYDEAEHFFMSYAHTYKRMPARLQRVLKLEMMTLFARYELQAESFEEDVSQKNDKRF